jgi:asparagine synthase (glutamine-hydrolysing)
LVDRPKQGFGIPIGSWLRGPLRDWAESRLSEKSLIDSGFFDAQMIRKQWSGHLLGTHDRQSEVWAALVFQEWLSEQNRFQAPAVERLVQLA